MKVTFVEIATAHPMGQQAYESSIQQALADLAEPDLRLSRLRVTSLRNDVPAERRVPWGLLERSPALVGKLAGAWTYRGAGLVHRMDLRLPPCPGPEVVTAHDLPGLRFRDEGGVPRFLAAGARSARAVIVPSTFAGQELVELLGVDAANVHVVPYGLSPTYAEPPATVERTDLLEISERFVLHAAGATDRKNLAALAAAWQTVSRGAPDVRLLLCGPEDARRTSLFSGLERVQLLGRLMPSDVSWLMHRASAVVVPSTYEGFGLPALEGMAAGAPVVAARAGALPEVCGVGALLVEPDARGIAGGLMAVLSEDGLRDDLVERGRLRARDFDWAVAARAHLEIYRAVT